jgi:hypothetical protein
MTWREYHAKSQQLAADAELAARSGYAAQVIALYTQAAETETHAISQLDITKKRTLSITVVSAVALWYKARNEGVAESLAYEWHAKGVLEPFAIHQLQELLRRIWDERAQELAGVKFTRGDVFVSVRGGEVLTGAAPMDLVLRLATEISAILYRTAELLIREPHRRRGVASPFIQEACRPWFLQAVPTSYHFAVHVQQPQEQLDLFPESRLKIEKVLPTFLRIVTATTENPEQGLNDIVPDEEYRLTFLKLLRNLAPTGKTFHELDFQYESSGAEHHIILEPGTRVAINRVLRTYRPRSQDGMQQVEVQLTGILRGLHLDEDWVEIAVKNAEEQRTIRVYDARETLDDVVGPLVNREVVVDALLQPNGRHLLRDIQGAE